MKREEELMQQIRPLTEELNSIKEAKALTEKLLLLGRCFKYCNSYSCPESDADRWWLYTTIVGIDADGDLALFQFETDVNGKIQIEKASRSFFNVCGYEEITETEFTDAWKRVAKVVANINPFQMPLATREKGE